MIILLLQIIMVVLTCSHVYCEYAIVNDHELSYLHHKFYNIREDIFPRDISVQVSISRMVGTLLYSIDRNMNQLIVTLHESGEAVLGVEFNKQENFISMPTLCGCQRCQYEILNIRIQVVTDNIDLDCNDRDSQTLSVKEEKGLNKGYPTMLSEFKKTTSLTNEAHLWLVNIPYYGEVMPNSHQTYGCIFNVWYFRKPIYFLDKSKNIKSKCNKTCTENVCNRGVCYETYNDRPVCNCTATFRDGVYCNDSLIPLNLITNDSLFVFDILKLSWVNTTSTEILLLNNTMVSILLGVNGGELFLQYSYQNGHEYMAKASLSKHYRPKKENICVIQFHSKFIDIKLLSDGGWDTVIVPTTRDLRSEIFDTVTVRSGTGVIGIYYKYKYEYRFHKLNFGKHIILPSYNSEATKINTTISNVQDNSMRNTDYNEMTNYQITIIIVSILSVVLPVIIILFSILYAKRRPRRNTGDIENEHLDNKHRDLNLCSPTDSLIIKDKSMDLLIKENMETN